VTSRINVAAAEDGANVLQVTLINVFGCLGLHDVEFSGQVEEIVVQVRVGHDFDDFVKFILFQILEISRVK
jgi:hypothetical protein